MGELIKRTTKHFISNNNCSSNGHNNPSSNRNNGNIYRRQKHNPGSGFEPAVFLMLSQALSVCVSCGHLFFSVCWYRNTSSLSLSFIILCVLLILKYLQFTPQSHSFMCLLTILRYPQFIPQSHDFMYLLTVLSLETVCDCSPYWDTHSLFLSLTVAVHHTEIPTIYPSISQYGLYSISNTGKSFLMYANARFFLFFFGGGGEGGGGEGEYLIIPCGKSGSPYPGKSQQPQEHRYPFLSVCGVFSCIQTMIWLPVFGIFNVRSDADACDCTRGLCGHRQRVRTESWPREKNPLPHPGLEPASVLRLALSSVPVTMWGTVKHVRSVWSTRRVPRRHTRTRP